MKTLLLQLNPKIGDIENNIQKIVKELEKANNTNDIDLIITTELFLTGYPPKDLLESNWFMDKVEAGIEKIKNLSLDLTNTAFLIGSPRKEDGKLYNSAFLIENGRVLHIYDKKLLPSYDVFDELRYFTPGKNNGVFTYKGVKLGINICEDAWYDLYKDKYSLDPLLQQREADLFINLSASPFYAGKIKNRINLISNHSKQHNKPFIYVNQVGANDELIFDGASLITNSKGNIVNVLKSFDQDSIIIKIEEIDSQNRIGKNKMLTNTIAQIHDALILGIRDYFKKISIKKALVGLSGGIDSALTCYLAVKALGKENVHGITMPSKYSSSGSVKDSEELATNLGIHCDIVPIKDIYDNYVDVLKPLFKNEKENVAEENLQARARGNILMAYSNKFGHLVLTTGNKSEMAVGYCTLYGDMSGGLAVLSDLPKIKVYELSEYINRDNEIIPWNTINKKPSAELRPDQFDEDSLPPYEILDAILELYIEEHKGVDEIVRKGYDEKVTKWVINTVNKNEYKRRQAATGLKVTSKAFGFGRRMPIAAKYE